MCATAHCYGHPRTRLAAHSPTYTYARSPDADTRSSQPTRTQPTLRARSKPTLTSSWAPWVRQRRRMAWWGVCQKKPLPLFSKDAGVPLLKIWSTWFNMNSITTCWTRTARKAASPLQPVASISLDLNHGWNTFSEWVHPQRKAVGRAGTSPIS